MSVIINVIALILVLGVVIFVHELGHLLAAKKVDAKVKEFAIGFGPKVKSWMWGETEYSIRLIPVGGFVDILGEGGDVDDTDKDDPRSFRNKSAVERVFILGSGVAMNILLAVVIAYVTLGVSDFSYYISPRFSNYVPPFGTVSNEILETEDGELLPVMYTEVLPDSSADLAGLPNDGVIKSIAGTDITYSSQVTSILHGMKGRTVKIVVCPTDSNRSCNEYSVDVSDSGTIGIRLTFNYARKVSFESLVDRSFVGFEYIVNWLSFAKYSLSSIWSEARITGDYSEASQSLSSPVALYGVVADSLSMGWIMILSIVGDISMSLAVFNLLPIPALDGGRILLVGMEKLLGRRYNKKIEDIFVGGSFVFLILLMVIIIVKDIVAL